MPRRPDWPAPWLQLSVLSGGSVALRASMGYHSKTTLSGKISDASKWRRADALLLMGLLKRLPSPPAITDLIPKERLDALLTPEELLAAGVGIF